MISLRQRFIAIIAAILLHLSAILLITHISLGGAQAEGEQGIEIDLGMLGNLGTAAATKEESTTAETETPQEVNEPAEIPPEPTPDPVSEPTPEPTPEPPPVVMKQRAELTVKKKQEPTPTEKPIAKKTATPQPETPVAETTPATTADHDTLDQEATQKISTGSANATTSGGHAGSSQTYYSLIAATLAKHKRYPKSSRKKGHEGTVILTFTILRSGRIEDARIKQSSGYSKLDRSVKKMLKDASPLPPFPADMTQPKLTISIPIVFKLNQ